MRVNPLVVLPAKRFLRKLFKKLLMLLFHTLKLRPFLLKVDSLKLSRPFYTLVTKPFDLGLIPKRQYIHLLAEHSHHVIPDIRFVLLLVHVQ